MKKEHVTLQEAYSKILLTEMPYTVGPKGSGIEPALPAAKKSFDVGAPGNEEAANTKERYFGPEKALNDASVPIDFTKTVLNVDDKETLKTLLTNPAEEGGKQDYSKAYGGIHKSPQRRNQISRLMLGVCEAVFAMIEDSSGTLPDTRGEMQERISSIIRGITGWSASNAIHPARQVLAALVEAGIITELKGSTAHGARSASTSASKSIDW